MKPTDTSVRYLLSSSPHAHASVSVTRLMLDVILALLPTTAAGIAFFGWPALWTVLTCVVSAVATEALCRRAMGITAPVGNWWLGDRWRRRWFLCRTAKEELFLA